MAAIMTKRGSQDNVVTYEHICDTRADMASIEDKYITLGSTCIILKGTSGGMEVYIADSDRQWQSLAIAGASSGSGGTVIVNSSPLFHVCTSSEVRANGTPKITSPEENTIYLVPTNGKTNNLFNEYLYVNSKWEMIGSAGTDVDLSQYVTQNDLNQYATQDDLSEYAPINHPNFNYSISMSRADGSDVGSYSVAVGSNVTASEYAAYAEGAFTIASGSYSHAEGYWTNASGRYSHTEGYYTEASAERSHAEGNTTYATGISAHTEGDHTTASGTTAHAEGYYTKARGNYSHAQGYYTNAVGGASSVLGAYNVDDTYLKIPTWKENTDYQKGDIVRFDAAAQTSNLAVQRYICISSHTSENSKPQQLSNSRWNAIDYMKYIEIVGNGRSNDDRSNARTLDWHGNEYLNGDLYINCNKDSSGGTKVLAAKRNIGEIQNWKGLTDFNGRYIWSDGENIYYSKNENQKILNKATKTWIEKEWQGLTNFYRQSIWTDGENIYYSKDENQYVLDKENSTWNTITWKGVTSFSASNIWRDDTNIYLNIMESVGGGAQTKCYKLINNNSWKLIKTFNVNQYISGSDIWTDGTNIYGIYDSTYHYDYKLNKSTFQWEQINWNINFTVDNIWSDGENIYCSKGTDQYILDKITQTWSPIAWGNIQTLYGNDIWINGTNIYYSNGTTHYIIDRKQKVLLSDSNTGEWVETNVKDFVKDYLPIPTPPTTDGTYTLQVTITDGTPTYSWV